MNKRIQLILGDITKIKSEAIVNAANPSLLGGSGVDGAIHRAGGPTILEECKKIGGCRVGEAVVTSAGKLSSKYIIHTVGPVWYGGNRNENQVLTNAYQNCLIKARDLALETIAFPNISTGVYNFPKDKAAEIAIHTVRAFLDYNLIPHTVIFCCFDEENYIVYNQLLSKNN